MNETFDLNKILNRDDRLRVGWLNGFSLEGVPREQKMLKGHLPRVIYHQVYFSIRRYNTAFE